MQERDLRKWHRYLGISLAIFLIVQAGSGLSISLGHLTAGHMHATPAHAHGNEKKSDQSGHVQNDAEKHPVESKPAFSAIGSVFTSLHHGGGVLGSVYRIVLAVGILLQAVTGSLIFFKMRGRSKQPLTRG